MKKKIFTVSVSVVLILSVVLLGACVGGQPIKEKNVNLNQAQASAPSVKNSEVVSVSTDEAINVALKHAGVARENAVCSVLLHLMKKTENAIMKLNSDITVLNMIMKLQLMTVQS